MKRPHTLLQLAVSSIAMLTCSPASARAQTTAFYYGRDLPMELTALYDQIVVEPANIADFAALTRTAAVPVAYFSIGEVSGQQLAEVDAAWILTRNSAWASAVMDLRNPNYVAYVIRRFESLWSTGYRRFFLDTLDSYQLGAHDPAERERLRLGLVTLIESLLSRHPDARLLLNRGFEILPQLGARVHGVVAESLFDRWDAAHAKYVPVPAADRAWLLERLREVQRRYQLQVTVIDYRPSHERAEARATARKIAALGFAPWICNSALTNVGVGHLELMPRRVLVLSEATDAATQPGPARWLAPILEYLGYVPEYRALQAGLPEYELAGRYQGVVTTFEPGFISSTYGAWFLRQAQAGTRFAVLGGLGFEPDARQSALLGIEPVEATRDAAHTPGQVLARDALIGFEAEPPPRSLDGVSRRFVGAAVQHHLQVADEHGQMADAIATSWFGGVAQSHVFALRGLTGERAWVLDPFAFLARALALPDMPVPDLTTESGRRLALFVIDAQGLGERARLRGRPYVWAVIRDQLLAEVAFPHAIDLDSSAQQLTADDRRAAARLLELPHTYRADLAAGQTDLRRTRSSLTFVAPLFATAQGAPIAAPIAQDAQYVEASPEAYPYRRVRETLEYTDAPRRLCPIALHYHGFSAASPGGLETLQGLYAWVAEQGVFPTRVADYAARLQAFRELAMARHLDGSFSLHGGVTLRTLRVPATLGLPDLRASQGVAGVRTLPQGQYLTFSDDPGMRRHVVFGQRALNAPHLVQANGVVKRFDVEDGAQTRVKLELSGHEPLEFELAGLPPSAACELRTRQDIQHARTTAQGACSFVLATHETGSATLTCTRAEAKP